VVAAGGDIKNGVKDGCLTRRVACRRSAFSAQIFLATASFVGLRSASKDAIGCISKSFARSEPVSYL
jgi:hypothetical protein